MRAFNRKDPKSRLQNYPDNISIVYYLTGSAFLFATFMFLGTHIRNVLAGFLTSVIMAKVWPLLNENGLFDSQGFIFPVLIATFIGDFITFPCIIVRHLVLESSFKEEEWQAAGFQFAILESHLVLL